MLPTSEMMLQRKVSFYQEYLWISGQLNQCHTLCLSLQNDNNTVQYNI